MTVRFSLLLWERGEWADAEEERWVLIGSNEQKMGSPILPCQKNACWQLLPIVSQKKKVLEFWDRSEIQKDGDPEQG